MKSAVDASVLIFFAKLNKLELLPKLFGKLFVSSVVLSEVMNGESKGFREAAEVQKLVSEGKILVVSFKGTKPVSGEKATIAAAKTEKAEAVLMDDFAGIKEAKLQGLKAYSCPFILLKALKLKHISRNEFSELLDRLLSYNYFISPRMLKKIIELSEKA